MNDLDETLAAARRAIAAEPDQPDVYEALAGVLNSQGDLAGMAACYRQVIERWPEWAEAHHNLSVALGRLGLHEEALAESRIAAKLRPDLAAVHFNLACLHKDARSIDEAACELRATLSLEPDHAAAQFLLSAMTGSTVAAPPPNYVATLFDRYADRFDQHLTGPLAYRVPQLIEQTLLRVARPRWASWRVLDLGCGTGLVGAAVRPYAAHLAGVDLSAGMIEQARRRGVYDELYVGDAAAALESASASWNLVVAADVLPYIGELDRLFRACAAALAPRGWFAFSTESCLGQPYLLQTTGRYAHWPVHVQSLAHSCGFRVRELASIVVRVERGQGVAGHLWLLSRS